MMKTNALALGALVMLLSFAGFACSRHDNPTPAPAPVNDEPLARTPAPAPGSAEGQPATDPPATPTDQDPATPQVQTKQIVLAGGCFWCTEAVYEQLKGVIDVESGYAGGDAETANYAAVCTGLTKHAEVVRITYDPSKITLGTILQVFFTTAHDPTQLNRQGVDVGPQYRSAVFYADDQQKQITADYIKLLEDKGYHDKPIVTTLEPLEAFYPAERYHQDYARNNPNNGYILQTSRPKVEKTQEAFRELLREGEAGE